MQELPGTWVGTGVYVLTRPAESAAGAGPRIEVHASRESITFARVALPGFAEDFGAEAMQLPGAYFLHRANDLASGASLHVESGTWLNTPQEPGTSIARLSRRLHGEALFARGTHHLIEGPPRIAALGTAVEEETGRPVTEPASEEAVLLPSGIELDALADPCVVLRRAIAGRRIVRTTVLSVAVGDGAPGSAPTAQEGPFAVANPDGVSLELALYLESVSDPSRRPRERLQLQYARRLIVTADGVRWPEVSVATLERR